MYKIENCIFNGVKWDGEAIEAVNNVSEALLNLTKIFVGQNVEIEALLKLESPATETLLPKPKPKQKKKK